MEHSSYQAVLPLYQQLVEDRDFRVVGKPSWFIRLMAWLLFVCLSSVTILATLKGVWVLAGLLLFFALAMGISSLGLSRQYEMTAQRVAIISPWSRHELYWTEVRRINFAFIQRYQTGNLTFYSKYKRLRFPSPSFFGKEIEAKMLAIIFVRAHEQAIEITYNTTGFY